MKVYTFTHYQIIGGIEKEIEYFEFYDLRHAKKKALELAKKTNAKVLVTCMHKPKYKQDWFTAFPDGRFITDQKNISFDN